MWLPHQAYQIASEFFFDDSSNSMLTQNQMRFFPESGAVCSCADRAGAKQTVRLNYEPVKTTQRVKNDKQITKKYIHHIQKTNTAAQVK